MTIKQTALYDVLQWAGALICASLVVWLVMLAGKSLPPLPAQLLLVVFFTVFSALITKVKPWWCKLVAAWGMALLLAIAGKRVFDQYIAEYGANIHMLYVLVFFLVVVLLSYGLARWSGKSMSDKNMQRSHHIRMQVLLVMVSTLLLWVLPSVVYDMFVSVEPSHKLQKEEKKMFDNRQLLDEMRAHAKTTDALRLRELEQLDATYTQPHGVIDILVIVILLCYLLLVYIAHNIVIVCAFSLAISAHAGMLVWHNFQRLFLRPGLMTLERAVNTWIFIAALAVLGMLVYILYRKPRAAEL